MAGWPTAKDVLQKAAIQLGLTTLSDIGDPFSATDVTFLQLCSYLETVGRDLVDAHDWSHLRKERILHSKRVTTEGSVTTAVYDDLNGGFPLPPDFRDMVSDATWNRSNRLPSSPLSAQQWQNLKSRLTGVVYNAFYRPMQGLFFTFPDSAGTTVGGQSPGQTFSFEYKSSWWVNNATPPAWVSETAYKVGDLVSVDLLPINDYASNFAKQAFVCVQAGYSSRSDNVGQAITSSGAMYFLPAGFSPNSPGQPPVLPSEQSALLVDTGAAWNLFGVMGTRDADGAAGDSFANFGTTDAVTKATDVLMFDTELLVSALKLKWRMERGFSFDVAEADYRRRLEAAMGNDLASPTLSLSKNHSVGDLLLGPQSMPFTGYGT